MAEGDFNELVATRGAENLEQEGATTREDKERGLDLRVSRLNAEHEDMTGRGREGIGIDSTQDEEMQEERKEAEGKEE